MRYPNNLLELHVHRQEPSRDKLVSESSFKPSPNERYNGGSLTLLEYTIRLNKAITERKIIWIMRIWEIAD